MHNAIHVITVTKAASAGSRQRGYCDAAKEGREKQKEKDPESSSEQEGLIIPHFYCF